MSKSGVLLRVNEPLEPNTAIEMEVQLPAMPGEGAARVICSGRILHTVAIPDAHGLGNVISATIARYRFDR